MEMEEYGWLKKQFQEIFDNFSGRKTHLGPVWKGENSLAKIFAIIM